MVRLSPAHHNRVLKPLTVLSLLRIGCFRVCAATIATMSDLCLLSLNGPGEYFGDKIHRFGVYYLANGHCYEGAWHKGRRQGIGTYTFRKVDRRCGEWNAGNLKHPLPPHSHAVLRALQAARKTADSAINLRRVDDEVNKAVIATNRAAKAARVATVKAVQNIMDGQFCDTDV